MIDLRDQLTVFVVSSGEPSLDQCNAYLDRQDCEFTRQHIQNVSPMDRAFQTMLDQCVTPYYVQVDADMLLNPAAVRTLYEACASASVPTAFVVGWLWDDDVVRPIQGVKCYRHAVCHRYPYRESASCEVDQITRMKDDGFSFLSLPLPEDQAGCLGVHFASQTPEMAFRRWQRLMQKHRRYPHMGWLAPYPARLMERWMQSEREIDRWKVLGAIAGLTGDLPPDSELDSGKVNRDFRRLDTYLGEASKGPREIVLYLTDRCNFKCHFDGVPCRREVTDGVAKSGDITPSMLSATLDRYPSIKAACVAGFGEPLLHPELPALLEVLRSHGCYVGLITNGSQLYDKADTLIAGGVGYVTVSLNAATPEKHREVTRTKTWDRVLEGIRRMVQSRVQVGLTFVVGRSSVDLIPGYIDLATDLGVKFVYLHNVLPHNGVDETFLSQVITPTCPEAQRLEDMRRLATAEIVKIWPQPVDGTNIPGRCMSPFVTLGVDGAGHTTACRRVDPPSPRYGGVFWENHWFSPEITNLRLQLLGDRELQEMCKWCFGNWRE